MKESIVFKRLAGLFRTHLKSVTIILTCLMISAGMNMLLPLTSRLIMDDGLLKGNMHAVILYTSAAFVLVCSDKLLHVCKEAFRAGLSANITYSLYERAYLHLTRLE